MSPEERAQHVAREIARVQEEEHPHKLIVGILECAIREAVEEERKRAWRDAHGAEPSQEILDEMDRRAKTT